MSLQCRIYNIYIHAYKWDKRFNNSRQIMHNFKHSGFFWSSDVIVWKFSFHFWLPITYLWDFPNSLGTFLPAAKPSGLWEHFTLRSAVHRCGFVPQVRTCDFPGKVTSWEIWLSGAQKKWLPCNFMVKFDFPENVTFLKMLPLGNIYFLGICDIWI